MLYTLKGILLCSDSQPRDPNWEAESSQKNSGSNLTIALGQPRWGSKASHSHCVQRLRMCLFTKNPKDRLPPKKKNTLEALPVRKALLTSSPIWCRKRDWLEARLQMWWEVLWARRLWKQWNTWVGGGKNMERAEVQACLVLVTSVLVQYWVLVPTLGIVKSQAYLSQIHC